MPESSTSWDFFIAHAATDLPAAQLLFQHLSPHSRVFLDSHCIRLGDDWDRTIAAAQRDSLVTVVLVSEQANVAYYQREEIAAAISFARADPRSHRVIPIFIGSDAQQSAGVPYGLRLKHGLVVHRSAEWEDVASKLLRLLEDSAQVPVRELEAREVKTVKRDRPQRLVVLASFTLVIVAVTAWWMMYGIMQSGTTPGGDGGARSGLICGGREGSIAIQAFAKTMVSPESLSSFVRENASVFAAQGGGVNCLNHLMNVADTYPRSAATTDCEQKLAALVRTRGPEVIATIARTNETTSSSNSILNGDLRSSTELLKDIQITLQGWGCNYDEATLFKSLHELSMTPIRNLR
jgi:hypothetical protein